VVILAKTLKRTYGVIGSFYTLQFQDGTLLNCRNVLEIYKGQIFCPYQNKLPDALFVMMNPGSSRPWDKEYISPIYTDALISDKAEITCTWTKAYPDITQYQVMRVMAHKGWNHVRVINLSDIRSPKSSEFKSTLKTLNEYKPKHLHSIFSPARKRELEKMLRIKQCAPIVLAWGTDEFLSELAVLGLQALPMKNRKGVRSGFSGLLFFHASPTLQEHKERWLKGILKALGA